MNLKLQLFVRIFVIALLCITASAYYVLYQTDQQAIYEANLSAKRIKKQMQVQLLQMFSRYDYTPVFPNTKLWPAVNGLPGSCMQFVSRTSSRQRSLCNDSGEITEHWPHWFATLYHRLFHPDYEAKQQVAFNAMQFGTIVVSLNEQMEVARAWNNLRATIGLLTVSILIVGLLAYFFIHRMLKPAQLIVSGLEKMQQGQLDTRLPSFEIEEWKRTSDAINQLAHNQQLVLNENRKLALKLMNVQEEEHRYITRELHDEFGQCLAGINALTTSITQTAREQCPALLKEAGGIQNITGHMMTALRSLLTRLRPAEVDDFGLTQSLHRLIKSWNNRSGDTTQYHLSLQGDFDNLPDPLPVNIYRIVQECLTNIAKHAEATKADISLNYRDDGAIKLTVSDDGVASPGSFDNTIGIGLLGIRERVSALGGACHISSNEDESGLLITITIPLSSTLKDAP